MGVGALGASMRLMLFLMAAMYWPLVAHGAVYQCDNQGEVVFSDTPCGDNAVEITVDPFHIGGNFDATVQPRSHPPIPEINSPAATNIDCPYINTTRLRRYIVEKKVAHGMKPNDVERAWGRPTSIIRSSRGERWSYHHSDVARDYVYFENGCVVDWQQYERLQPERWRYLYR